MCCSLYVMSLCAKCTHATRTFPGGGILQSTIVNTMTRAICLYLYGYIARFRSRVLAEIPETIISFYVLL